jgi:hypothetical protein
MPLLVDMMVAGESKGPGDLVPIQRVVHGDSRSSGCRLEIRDRRHEIVKQRCFARA